MKILVTGGTGYIGSHTSVALLEAGHAVAIADNLSNSKIDVLDKIETISGKRPAFYHTDVTDRKSVYTILSDVAFDGVIHFAGHKSIEESITDPLKYYYNNVVSTVVLAEACIKFNVRKFVFSSSATVYGGSEAPFSENMELKSRTNPYGETKAVCEQILRDFSKSNPDTAVTILRYFNPIGAHESALIGDEQIGSRNNLMPYIVKVAKGELTELHIYGNDYPTPDGTGIRDYIHVMDLAEGHVAALERCEKGVEIFNLGTGKGTSVLELVRNFEKVNGILIPYEFCARRIGDVASSFACTEKAERKLNWKAKRSIHDMVQDAWRFESSYRKPQS